MLVIGGKEIIKLPTVQIFDWLINNMVPVSCILSFCLKYFYKINDNGININKCYTYLTK